jgi:K+-transporting ATPase ATPase C chain
MLRQLRPALLSVLVLTVLTGLVYPLVITGIAQVVFPHQANGSLITRHGKVVGSSLIGQPFTGERYFWSRPSATAPAYNGGSSTGANWGATNPALLKRVGDTVGSLQKAHGTAPIPVDLATASASGLDPHISPAAAAYQVARVAKSRGLDATRVRQLVEQHTEGRQLGFLGEPRVNVLELNLALDDLGGGATTQRSQ